MDRLLARLERTFLGRLTTERLPAIIVASMATVFLLKQVRPDVLEQLILDPHRLTREPWRVVTFLFIPPDRSIFWIVFALMFTWWVMTSLESMWGTFKFNAYYACGIIGTIAGAVISGYAHGNYYLNQSLLFALATLAPDLEILFFFFSVRLKWVALLALAIPALEFFSGDMGTRIAIGVSFGNYLLFFGGHLLDRLRGQKLELKQAARRAEQRAAARAAVPDGRVCAICGARQDDGADIRVCSCEKCGGKPRDLCLEHARNH